ncbi:MAG: hypothetical protein Sapg2KO_46890 [Saprospiraceae bacterium]
MNYQAIARDVSGQFLANQTIEVKASYTSKDGKSSVYYSETHKIVTDQNGLFSIQIGNGLTHQGAISEIPWADNPVFLSIELAKPGQDFKLVSRSQMLSVPYAFHAAKTGSVQDTQQVDLRNQSIYWTTSGNNQSRPNNHFIGTRDDKDLVLQTNVDITPAANQHSVTFTNKGQLRVKAGTSINGMDTQKAAYPVTVEGSNQGIYIKIDEPRTNANNFVSFADDTKIWGAVQGETWDELTATPQYGIQIALFTLKGVSIIGQTVAMVATAISEGISVLGAGAAPGSTAAAIVLGIEAAALLVESINWGTYLAETVGVSYNSGGADYAEYILRAKEIADLLPAQVVGVKGGVVSLNTTEADHFRVISLAPIVLGNMPQPDQEHLYEKVAFRGQVPVNVVGAVTIGDYILPSGNNDGLAIAVHPDEMKIGDYQRIIGVAWSEAEFAPVNIINVAIGLNSNDLGPELELLDQKVTRILDYLQGKGTLSGDLDTPSNQTDKPNSKVTSLQKLYTDQEFDTLLDDNQVFLETVYREVKKQMQNQGIDLKKYPQVVEFLDDPLPVMKQIRRDPQFFSQWAAIDQDLKEKTTNN